VKCEILAGFMDATPFAWLFVFFFLIFCCAFSPFLITSQTNQQSQKTNIQLLVFISFAVLNKQIKHLRNAILSTYKYVKTHDKN